MRPSSRGCASTAVACSGSNTAGAHDPAPEGRNCRWSQHLTWSDAEPAGWPAGTIFPTRSWRRLRAHVHELVRGHGGPPPCNGQPITWGGDMDATRAAAQGLVALDCGDTNNTGYARAGH